MASIVTGLIEQVKIDAGANQSIASTAYGVCNTLSDQAAKTVEMTGFKLITGVTVHIKFTYSNAAENPPTLNINNTGAKSIVQYGTTSAGTNAETNGWQAGAVLSLTYDGTSWVRDQGYNTNTNTWRGIQDNLTSDSATDSLSAKQGKALKGLIDAMDATTPNASGNATAFIDSITQTDGKITSITKKNIPTVSKDTAGLAPKGAAVSTQSQSTKFLREDGSWATPSYTTNTNNAVTQTITSDNKNYRILFSGTDDDTTRTEGARKDGDLLYNPSTNTIGIGTGTLSATAYSGKAATAGTADSANNVAWANTNHPSTFPPSSHTHGNITNDGTLGTANVARAVVTNASNQITTDNFAQDSPTVPASGTTTSLEFIDTVSQGASGKITATKKKIPNVSKDTAGLAPKGAAVSTQSQSTKFLREDGSWAAPSYTTNTDAKVAQTGNTENKEFSILLKGTNDTTDKTEGVKYGKTTDKLVTVNPSTGRITAPGGLAGVADSANAVAWGNVSSKPTSIKLTGAVTGSVTLGSGENSITTTVNHTHTYLSSIAWDNSNKKITQSVNGAAATAILEFVAGSNITLTPAAGKLTIANSYSYTLPIALYNKLGGLKPAYTSTAAATLTTAAATNTDTPTIAAKTTTSGRYYAVEADKNGIAYVNVPWTDHYTWGDITGKPTKITLTGAVTGSVSLGAGDLSLATTVNHNHDSTYSYIHLTDYSFTATRPLSKYVTFDKSNPDGAPTATWYNGFISSHNNYLASYIINAHRTDNWYVGYGQFDTSTNTAPAPTWYKLAHSGNVSTGDNNGQVKIAGQNVSVKGLKALAYKDSLTYSDVGAAASNHNHNGTYVPNTTGANDVNTLYNTGIYNITSGSLTNGPVGYGYGQLIVMSYRKHTGNTTTDWAIQLYAHLGTGNNGNTLYFRTSNASTWQTWQMVAHANAGTARGDTKKPIYINAKGEIQEGDALKNLAYKDSLIASDIPNLSWNKITSDKPTTLSGYGITDAKIASGVITLGSNTITPVTSVNGHTGSSVSVTAADLGLSKAMRFIGVATVAIIDGSTTDPVISGYSTKTAGDVIIDKDSSREYVWSTTGKWELLGGDSSYKVTQSAVDSGAAATNKWVSRIQQNANGVITATMGTLDTSGTWSGNAATATKWATAQTLTIGNKGQSVNGSSNVSWALQDVLIRAGNEFNYTADGIASLWFNYKTQTGTSATTKITEYNFGNGQGSITGVTLKAAAFSGNAATATAIQTAGTTAQFYRGDNTWSNTISGGLFKITNNSNTVTIGSANTSWCHFENSANIPFYFNHQINAVDGFKVYNTTTSLTNNNLTFSQGGGWYMADTTWIRTVGSKSVYMNTGTFRNDGITQLRTLQHVNANIAVDGGWTTGATGTNGDGTNAGTTGTSILTIGNGTAVTKTNGAGGNNSRGYLRIYSDGTGYGELIGYTTSARTHIHASTGISFPENIINIMFRPGLDSYYTHVSYQTSGNEALVAATQNAVTSFIFVNGESYANVASDRWTKLTGASGAGNAPGLQIKQNCVSVGELIPNGTNATYKLNVNGTTNIKDTLYANYYASSSSITSRITSINFTGHGNAGAGRTKMRLDLVTTSCTTGSPPIPKTNGNSSGYLHTYYWDSNDAAMTQIYIPNGDHVTSTNGPQCLYMRGYDSGWKDWVAIPTGTGTGASGTWGISITGSSASCTGNAATATTLQTARTINGTNFDGSANITTANWGTTRAITVGATSKNVNGSAAVSWTKAEILGTGTTGQFYRGDNSWSDTISGGTLKITNNSNTVTIGSQNTSFTHIYNSANIPFIFNQDVLTTGSHNLGSVSWPWGNLYIGAKGSRSIYYVGTKATHAMITFLDNTSDTYGNGIKIGGGGAVVVGAGESAGNLSVTAGTETLYLVSDSVINIEAGGDTIANRIGFQITAAGHIVPVKAEAVNNNVQNLGASDNKWANVYATNFVGNASTATKATQDSDGNAINSTYFKLTETRAATTSNIFSITNATASTSTTTGALKVKGGVGVEGNIYANQVYNAVWNDYAEYRKCDELAPGMCVQENDDGKLTASNHRLIPACSIITDTFGFSEGKTDDAKTPVAVAGRVLAYTYLPRHMYHAGMAVCSAPGGTIDAMTREEIRGYPDCIIGYVSEIPDYEEWGSGNVKVNGRIWIKVK